MKDLTPEIERFPFGCICFCMAVAFVIVGLLLLVVLRAQ